MAENPIRKEDIIDIDGTVTGLNELVKMLNLVIALMTNIRDMTKTDLSTIIGINPADKTQQKAIEDITTRTNDYKKSLTELEKIKIKLTKATSDEGQELAEYKLKLQQANKEAADQARYNEAAEGSLARLRIELERSKKAFASGTDTTDEHVQKMQQLDRQVKELEKTMGVQTRSVGSYKDAIMAAGKELMSFAGVAVLAQKFLAGLKDAIQSTTVGINFMNLAGQAWKQLMYDIVTTGGMNTKNMDDAVKAQAKLNTLRVEEYKDGLLVSEINRGLQKDRIEAVDKTKTQSERLEILNKVKAEEAKITAITVRHLEKELDATVELLDKRPKDEKLLAKYYEIRTKINDTYAQEDQAMRRVESQRTQFLENDIKEHEERVNKLVGAYKQDEEAAIEAGKKKKEIQQEVIDLLVEEKKRINDIIDKSKEEIGAVVSKYNLIKNIDSTHLEWNKRIGKENEKIIEGGARRELFAYEKTQEAKMDIARNASNLINSIAGGSKSLQKAALVADKAIAIAEVIIKTQQANAAMTAYGAAFSIPTGGASVVVAEGIKAKNRISEILSIASIIAATAVGLAGFAKGGFTGTGQQKDNTGERVAGVVHENEYVIPKEPTKKYRNLLEAIHKDNPVAIAAMLRNQPFHMVWTNMNKDMGVGDPYTKKMYELMSKTPSIYTDSDGNTVKEYPNGKKFIVKRHFFKN